MNEQKIDLLYKTFVAQAIGDAFGYVIEFKSWKDIQMQYGPNGFEFTLDTPVWVASDDTQMAIFCLDGLIKDYKESVSSNMFMEDPTDHIFKSYLDWYETQERSFELLKLKVNKQKLMDFEELFNRRAPGNTCLYSLKSKTKGTTRNRINDSKGCGGIMRTTPVAFFATCVEDAFNWGNAQAAITHGHIDGYLSAGVYSAICYELIHNTSNILKAIKTVEPLVLKVKGHENILRIINETSWHIKNTEGMEHDRLTDTLGEGWTGEEALAVALYCAATSISFKEVLEKSANHSGDSDSTAMLAAGLWFLANQDKDKEFMELDKKVDVINSIKFLINNLQNMEVKD